MAWLRIDDGFASHPKLAALTDRQFRVWMRVLCYCGRHRDPSVDEVAMREVAGLDLKAVKAFTSLGLLDRVPSGGNLDLEVHDWPSYQPKDSTNAARQARWRSRVTALRNAERNASVTEEDRYADRYGNGPSRADARGQASRPVPSRPTTKGSSDSETSANQPAVASYAADPEEPDPPDDDYGPPALTNNGWQAGWDRDSEQEPEPFEPPMPLVREMP